MKDPTPMIRESADEHELWMLLAARAERPRPGAQAELVAQLLAGEAADLDASDADACVAVVFKRVFIDNIAFAT